MNAKINANKIAKSTRLLALATCAWLLLAVMPPAVGQFSTTASWYGPRFHGKRTASGTRFDQNKMTAASRTLPFGTKLLVKNPRNGQTCRVTITDRGPYVRSRGLDLSRAAARQLGIHGVGKVICYREGAGKQTDIAYETPQAGIKQTPTKHIPQKIARLSRPAQKVTIASAPKEPEIVRGASKIRDAGKIRLASVKTPIDKARKIPTTRGNILAYYQEGGKNYVAGPKFAVYDPNQRKYRYFVVYSQVEDEYTSESATLSNPENDFDEDETALEPVYKSKKHSPKRSLKSRYTISYNSGDDSIAPSKKKSVRRIAGRAAGKTMRFMTKLYKGAKGTLVAML